MDILSLYCPIFHRDKYEKTELADMNEYIESNTIINNKTILGTVVNISTTKTLLHYFFFYSQDDGLPYCCYSIGGHKFDLEHIIVELTNNKISGVCYMPHGGSEFYWIRNTSDLQLLLKANHPVVYSSRGKHASYPISGTIYRYFCFANDHCDPVMIPIDVIEANSKTLATPLIDNVFAGITNRILGDFSQYPEIRLSKSRTKILWVIPDSIKTKISAIFKKN
jgi:hypothetical protein